MQKEFHSYPPGMEEEHHLYLELIHPECLWGLQDTGPSFFPESPLIDLNQGIFLCWVFSFIRGSVLLFNVPFIHVFKWVASARWPSCLICRATHHVGSCLIFDPKAPLRIVCPVLVFSKRGCFSFPFFCFQIISPLPGFTPPTQWEEGFTVTLAFSLFLKWCLRGIFGSPKKTCSFISLCGLHNRITVQTIFYWICLGCGYLEILIYFSSPVCFWCWPSGWL